MTMKVMLQGSGGQLHDSRWSIRSWVLRPVQSRSRGNICGPADRTMALLGLPLLPLLSNLELVVFAKVIRLLVIACPHYGNY